MWNDAIPELVEELFETPGPHGGPKETSMMLYLDRENVEEDRIRAARDGGLEEFEDYRVHGARTFYDAIDNTANGVLGDQTDASAEKGERLFEAATDQLCRLCAWLDDQPYEELMPKPRVTTGA